MSQKKNELPQSNAANRLRAQQAHAPHKSGVMQPKLTAAQHVKTLPAPPPTYRPQPVPKVLQTKTAAGSQQSHAAQSPRRPVAAPVYRPQAKPVTVQAKMAGTPQLKNHPAAPTVYKPQPVAQAKLAGSGQVIQARYYLYTKGQYVFKWTLASLTPGIAPKMAGSRQETKDGFGVWWTYAERDAVSPIAKEAMAPQVGLPNNEGDSGGVSAMVKKFAKWGAVRELVSSISSAPRVKRHNTSAAITGRIKSSDYALVKVPIHSIRSQHSIDNQAIANTKKRAQQIYQYLTQNNSDTLSIATLNVLAGSVGSIKLGWNPHAETHYGQKYITLDGVGRVEAIKAALSEYRQHNHPREHPLKYVEAYVVRLTPEEWDELYKTSDYFRHPGGHQRDTPQHDLYSYSGLPRFVVGTALNIVKNKVVPYGYSKLYGNWSETQPDRRVPVNRDKMFL